ncbi:hypothetical protein CFP56_027155 [Quercus suber]|uniref:Uncharacterized protein n=1 Tax=Quercus suber TaxID=58331 RepID=A0AAW0JZK3_QUESU
MAMNILDHEQPDSSGVKAADKDFHTKRLQGALDSDSVDLSGSTSFSTNPQKKQFKSDYGIQAQAISSFGEFNSEADAQANQAVNLKAEVSESFAYADGQVEEDCRKMPESVIPSAGEVNLSMLSLLESAR